MRRRVGATRSAEPCLAVRKRAALGTRGLDLEDLRSFLQRASALEDRQTAALRGAWTRQVLASTTMVSYLKPAGAA